MAADAATLQKAEEAIDATGFVTEKEIPELNDRDFSRELSDEVRQDREQKQEDGYIYTEPFDFAGGKITNIIWNMDEINTREAAKESLAQDMGLTITKTQLSDVDKKEF